MRCRAHQLTFGLIALLVLAALAALFWKPLFAGELLLFRDVAHFYTPLWEWARSEWGRGQCPLWNPLQNLGTSHVAENTSALFYPGKLLFALPLPFHALLNWFLVGHLALAAWTMYRLSRGLGCSPEAAAVASISYAFAGPILFQYCNPPFLIGAAWLPWAVLCSWRMIEQPTLPTAAGLASVLALMILGGDAQTVYHLGVVMVFGVALARRHRPGPPAAPALSRYAIGLGATLVFTAGLSAVQLLPTARQTTASWRASFEQPRNVIEAWQVWRSPDPDPALRCALLGHPGDEHHRRVYDFSVGPWRWVELIWPNFSGHVFPVHRRWTQLFPGEARAWVPSLYMGLLPCLLAAHAVRSSGGQGLIVRWFTFSAGFFVMAALGKFGLGWLAAELQSLVGRPAPAAWVGWPFGGLYWAMTVLLPGFIYFRYPAKLWTIVACSLSVLAALGWDRVVGSAGPCRTLLRVLLRLMCVSALGWALAGVLGAWGWRPPGADTARDALFGPLDMPGVWVGLQFAFAHTLTVSSALWWLFRADHGARKLWRPAILLILCVLDLCVAQRGMIASAPPENDNTLSLLPRSADAVSGDRLRVYRNAGEAWVPPSWSATSSAHRLSDVVRRNRDTVFPQYQQQRRWMMAPVALTLPGADWGALAEYAAGIRRDASDLEGWPSWMLDQLAISWELQPRPALPEGPGTPVPLAGSTQPAAFLKSRPSAGPRCWVVEDVAFLPPLPSVRRGPLRVRTRAIWGAPDGTPNFRQRSFVESPVAYGPTKQTPSPVTAALRRCEANCRIVAESSQEVVLRATLPRPGLVVLCDAYDAGWRVAVRKQGSSVWNSQPALRTNRVMRGVWLAAGSYEVRWSYLPRSVWVGAVVSGFSWLLSCGLLGARLRR